MVVTAFSNGEGVMVCGSYCLEQRINILMLSESYRQRHRHPHDSKIENALKVLGGRGNPFFKRVPTKNLKK